MPNFEKRFEPVIQSGEAANDPLIHGVAEDPNQLVLEKEKQNQENYRAVIDVFQSLKQLAGDKVFEHDDEPLPKEWGREMNRLIQQFMAIAPLNSGADSASVRQQFENMCRQRNFDREIVRFSEWKKEAEGKIAEVEERLAGFQVDALRFKSPEHGPVTEASGSALKKEA